MKIKIDKDYEEIIPNYLNNRQKDLALFREYILTQNMSEIEFIAHKLAGSAGSYGFHTLGKIAVKLESACQNKKMSEVESHIQEIEDYFTNLHIEFIKVD